MVRSFSTHTKVTLHSTISTLLNISAPAAIHIRILIYIFYAFTFYVTFGFCLFDFCLFGPFCGCTLMTYPFQLCGGNDRLLWKLMIHEHWTLALIFNFSFTHRKWDLSPCITWRPFFHLLVASWYGYLGWFGFWFPFHRLYCWCTLVHLLEWLQYFGAFFPVCSPSKSTITTPPSWLVVFIATVLIRFQSDICYSNDRRRTSKMDQIIAFSIFIYTICQNAITSPLISKTLEICPVVDGCTWCPFASFE